MIADWIIIQRDISIASEEELRQLYGEDVVITRKGPFNLIHLDDPGPEEVELRTAEFDPDGFLEDDCPECLELRETGGDVIFGDSRKPWPLE